MLKRKILVVDDQEINRKILKRILADEYEVYEAADGHEAIEFLRGNNEIHAIILDIIMPVMDGYEVLTVLKDDPILRNIPVIVSSQMDGYDSELKALSLGAQDFIAKPYKGELIRRRLENIISLRESAALINKAEKDELTGLYNKQFFFMKAKELLSAEPQKKYDLLCLGVERFQQISDTYGEQISNKVLQHIAKVLVEANDEEALLGRFFFDIFYIMVPHKDEWDPQFFRKLYAQINDYPIDMDIKLHCGIYHIADNLRDVNEIVSRAKLAAEENKGNYMMPYSYYDDKIRKRLHYQQVILSEMREALNKGQFQVYYQPKFDLKTEMIVGAEALVRWMHPEMGTISPADFIPIFEKNGFITLLDRYVWEKVCQDMRAWIDDGHPDVVISVNVSRIDLYNPQLTDILLTLIAKCRLNIKHFHLEITETAYTENATQIIDVVAKLRELGFLIEMDDFGSGYSSLNMLARMPVDILKLDMKLVQREEQDVTGRGIVNFVMGLAKWMHLMVIAEGVENSEQIARLRALDCDYVQGYYYAKPMALPDFLKALVRSKVGEEIRPNEEKIMADYAEEQEADAKKLAGRVMLIVDPMEVTSVALASIFIHDYVVVEKRDGHSAWEYLEQNSDLVDVIMLDDILPDISGLALLEKNKTEGQY